MGVLFVNQNSDTGWLPKDEDIEAFEELLEEATQQKAIFLPSGCTAHIKMIGGEDFVVIEQNPISSTVTKNQQKEVVKKIDDKTGKKTIFLLPGCTLSYFE